MHNQHELRAVVSRHCARRIAKELDVCDECKKKLARADRIDSQIDDMWNKYHTGWYERQEKKARLIKEGKWVKNPDHRSQKPRPEAKPKYSPRT